MRYLVIGDFFLDVLAPAHELTIREGMPTYRCEQFEYALGGAGNAAWCLRQVTDAPITLAAPIGEGPWCARVHRLLERYNWEFVPILSYGPPAIRLRVKHPIPLRIDTKGPAISAYARSEGVWLERLIDGRPFDAVLLTDHGYGAYGLWQLAAAHIVTPQTRILWDGSRRPPATIPAWSKQAILKLNEEEAAAWDKAFDWREHFFAAIVTRGRRPTVLYYSGVEGECPVNARDCPPVAYSGAGDAFAAAFLEAWANTTTISFAELRECVEDAQGFAFQYVAGLWRERYRWGK